MVAIISCKGSNNLYTKSYLPNKLKFMWGAKPKKIKNDQGEILGSYFELYAIKITERDGKAALSGDCRG